MIAFNQFFDLFREIWIQGIFGINVSEIIIGFEITPGPSISRATFRPVRLPLQRK